MVWQSNILSRDSDHIDTFLYSCDDPCAEASSAYSKFESSSLNTKQSSQCVIGDSSTVQHGGKFLKKWMAWLEDNAEVYYGGLEEMH